MQYNGEGTLVGAGENSKYCWVRIAIEVEPREPSPFRGAETGFNKGQRVSVNIVAIANDGRPAK